MGLKCIKCLDGSLLKSGNVELHCQNCNASYPILRDIPRFVETDEYVGNFSLEWKIHKKTQIDDNKSKSSAENFNVRFGFPGSFWSGKKVLDVGVGVGRYAKVALDHGAELWGVDLSYSVDVAKENLNTYPNAHFIQANVFDLPFEPESFDVIYSFGVLHHTPDPRRAFEGLLKFLKPGGVICLTLYEDHGMYHTSRYLRQITTKLPNAVLYGLSALMTTLLYIPYKYLGFRYGIFGRFAPISLSDNFKEAILDTFDCYSPKHQFTYADHEVFLWFKEAGLRDIDVRPQPVTILGFK